MVAGIVGSSREFHMQAVVIFVRLLFFLINSSGTDAQRRAIR